MKVCFKFSDMHQCFQQDLIRLRLLAARATVQNLSVQSGLGNEKEQVKLSAQVLFKVFFIYNYKTGVFPFIFF